jgi:hypothetical protein
LQHTFGCAEEPSVVGTGRETAPHTWLLLAMPMVIVPPSLPLLHAAAEGPQLGSRRDLEFPDGKYICATNKASKQNDVSSTLLGGGGEGTVLDGIYWAWLRGGAGVWDLGGVTSTLARTLPKPLKSGGALIRRGFFLASTPPHTRILTSSPCTR